jgi:hypothetical protein
LEPSTALLPWTATLSQGYSPYLPGDTDVFRTPKAVTIFNAPFVFTRLKLANLVSARVSLAPADANGKPWSSLYDQAGLCLVLDVPPESTVVGEAYINANRRWIKAGVGVFLDKPVCGMVVCDRFADWSLVPLSEGMMTIELVREVIDGKKTEILWVWATDMEKGRRQIREITLVFGEEEEAPKNESPRSLIMKQSVLNLMLYRRSTLTSWKNFDVN